MFLTLTEFRIHIGCLFINSLFNNTFDATDLLFCVSLRVLSHSTRNRSYFYIPFHSTSYNQNHSIKRMLCKVGKLI